MVDCESILVKTEYIPFAHGNPLNGDHIWLFSESGYLRPSTECGSITQHPSGIYITRSSSAKYSNLDNLPSLIATHGLSCSDVQNLNLTCLKCPFLLPPRSTKFTKPRLNHLKAGIDGKAAIDLGYQNDTGDREGYRQLIREATSKTFKLSKELWICNQRERDQMEKEGPIEFSSHDSTGPFVNTQMTL
jgi:hypothetical protein